MSNSTAQAESEITVDVLDVWRHYVPWGAAAVTRRVKAAVIEGLQLIERQDLVERILACDDAACVEAAGLSCDEVAPDWRPLCLWLAVRLKPHGQTAPYARLALAMLLADEAECARRGDDPANWTRLSSLSATVLASADLSPNREKLIALLSGDTGTSSPGRLHGVAMAMAKVRKQEAQADDEAEDHDTDGIRKWRLPRMRVLLDAIPEGMPEAKRMTERYAPLLKSLPLTSLPDADSVEAALSAEFPWLHAAAERVAADIRLARLMGASHFRCRPLLLVGPPGVGKSRWARRLAEVVGSPYGVIAAAGSSDSRSLSGTAAGWSTAMPSYPLVLMAARQSASPVVLVDEVDKAGGSDRNGRIHDALLGLLEQETARRWPDEALGVCADLSAVTWVLTANTTAGLPDALLTRLGVIEVGPPGLEVFGSVLEGILSDLALEIGGRRDTAPSLRALLEPDAVEALREAWVESGSPRRLRALVQAALAAAAKAMHRH